MKKIMLIIVLAGIPALTFAQDKTFKSIMAVSETTDIEMVEKKRDISIWKDKIVVSNYVGGTDDLNLKVNRTEKKERAFDGMATWYYCEDDEKNSRTGEFTEFIIVVPEAARPKKVELFQVIDEVTFIKKQFILN